MDDKGEMNFSKILFLHINRILTVAATDADMYIASVEAFSDVLYPYHQNNGLDLHNAQENYDAVMNLAEEYKGKKLALKEAERNLARAKFKALMVLAEEKGLLLEVEGEWTI